MFPNAVLAPEPKGCYAAELARWLTDRPRTTTWLNFGAGATFIASGFSILALGNTR